MQLVDLRIGVSVDTDVGVNVSVLDAKAGTNESLQILFRGWLPKDDAESEIGTRVMSFLRFSIEAALREGIK